MSQSDRGLTRGVAERSRPSSSKRTVRAPKEVLSQDQAPFSPFGRHARVRGLLLEVGGVFARDADESLSEVSIRALRSALQTFLSESRASDSPGTRGKGSLEGSTSRRGRSREGVSSPTELAEVRRKRLLTQEKDRAIIKRLVGGHVDGDQATF